MSKKQDNYLLKKAGLGVVKPGFHNLPAQGHIYGKTPTKDKYGARQVISNWVQHENSKVGENGKDFISMNRQGIKNGYTNSQALSEFRKNNQIKMKTKEGQKFYGINIPNQQFVYGIPNKPSTPIKNVITNSYAAQQEQLRKQRQAVLAMLEKDKNKPVQHVQKSPKQQKQPMNKKQAVEDISFKLSKFKNVQSKIKPMMQQNNSKVQPNKQRS